MSQIKLQSSVKTLTPALKNSQKYISQHDKHVTLPDGINSRKSSLIPLNQQPEFEIINQGKLENVKMFSDEASSSRIENNMSSNRESPQNQKFKQKKQSYLDFYDDHSNQENNRYQSNTYFINNKNHLNDKDYLNQDLGNNYRTELQTNTKMNDLSKIPSYVKRQASENKRISNQKYQQSKTFNMYVPTLGFIQTENINSDDQMSSLDRSQTSKGLKSSLVSRINYKSPENYVKSNTSSNGSPFNSNNFINNLSSLNNNSSKQGLATQQDIMQTRKSLQKFRTVKYQHPSLNKTDLEYLKEESKEYERDDNFNNRQQHPSTNNNRKEQTRTEEYKVNGGDVDQMGQNKKRPNSSNPYGMMAKKLNQRRLRQQFLNQPSGTSIFKDQFFAIQQPVLNYSSLNNRIVIENNSNSNNYQNSDLRSQQVSMGERLIQIIKDQNRIPDVQITYDKPHPAVNRLMSISDTQGITLSGQSILQPVLAMSQDQFKENQDENSNNEKFSGQEILIDSLIGGGLNMKELQQLNHLSQMLPRKSVLQNVKQNMSLTDKVLKKIQNNYKPSNIFKHFDIEKESKENIQSIKNQIKDDSIYLNLSKVSTSQKDQTNFINQVSTLFDNPTFYQKLCDQTDRLMHEQSQLKSTRDAVKSSYTNKLKSTIQQHRKNDSKSNTNIGLSNAATIQTTVNDNYVDENSKMMNKVKSMDQEILQLKYSRYLKEVDELNALKDYLAQRKNDLDIVAKQKIVDIIVSKQSELKTREKTFQQQTMAVANSDLL
ncbi:UNKNOWN [Stylonychia lemnae]|uniref:Uncharacterized protein n=1 Tax=Stylonychia lemnae TaxID=5949 RepID=A0A078AVD8_STYLE|nr:UNKNOWN [Stylonychia lemnae]|eukprot:CDW85242.1 UNKNOWN [Stylonychia lemnae]